MEVDAATEFAAELAHLSHPFRKTAFILRIRRHSHYDTANRIERHQHFYDYYFPADFRQQGFSQITKKRVNDIRLPVQTDNHIRGLNFFLRMHDTRSNVQVIAAQQLQRHVDGTGNSARLFQRHFSLTQT